MRQLYTRFNPYIHFTIDFKRYLDTFGRKNVLVILFDEFVHNQEEIVRGVFKFLDVDVKFSPNMTRVNDRVGYRFSLLHSIIHTRFPVFKKILPIKLRRGIRSWFKTINSSASKVKTEPDSLDALNPMLREDIDKLSDLLLRPEIKKYWL